MSLQSLILLVLSLSVFFPTNIIFVTSSPAPLLLTDALALDQFDRRAALEPRYDRFIDFRQKHALSKRQCSPDPNNKDKNGNPKWSCNGQAVTLQDIHNKIIEFNYASGRITMFYTKLGGRDGVRKCKGWAKCHPQFIPPKANSPDDVGFVMFDRICDNSWSAAVVSDYSRNKQKLGFDGDQFQKCKSQALAEQASGDVYFFIPKGVEAEPNSAWTGWEFPALKRNQNVNNVWRIDPEDPNEERVNIWKKGPSNDLGPDPKCKTDGTPA